MVSESNIISIFADELLSTLPSDWQEYFLSLSEEQIKSLPYAQLRKSTVEKSPPPTLKEFFDTTASLSLCYEIEHLPSGFVPTASSYLILSLIQ